MSREHTYSHEKHDVTMEIIGMALDTSESKSFQKIIIATDRGNVHCRYYSAFDAHKAVIFIGSGRNFDTPGQGRMYPSLAKELQKQGVAALWVRYRYSKSFVESILDVLAGATFLSEEGITSIGVVGHSLGGAVAMQAAAATSIIDTVVALSTQSCGADAAAKMKKDSSLLLIHGKQDEVLSALSSQYAYLVAHEPKRIILLDNVRHGLDEAVEEVQGTVFNWLTEKLV